MKWMETIAATGLALALAAPACAQNDKMTPIATPAQPNAIELGTGALPGAKATESWHQQYGSVFARNVTVATLTPFLPDPAKASGAAVIVARAARSARCRWPTKDGTWRRRWPTRASPRSC